MSMNNYYASLKIKRYFYLGIIVGEAMCFNIINIDWFL